MVMATEYSERFWLKTDRPGPDDCWNWLGAQQPDGYGRFRIRGKTFRAHRIAYYLFHEVMPVGVVRHRCDNPACCNPLHLRLGTHEDNMYDMHVRGRQRSGYKIGDEQKAVIRHRYETEDITQAQLATEWGLALISVKRILKGCNRRNKLTQEQARSIRIEYPTMSMKGLAKKYGVSVSAIYLVIKGYTWVAA